MSTHNIGFYEDLIKFIFQLSSNTHLISSSGQTAKTHWSFACCLYEPRHEKTWFLFM